MPNTPPTTTYNVQRKNMEKPSESHRGGTQDELKQQNITLQRQHAH